MMGMIKRYSIMPAKFPHDKGELVLYEDHMEAVAELEAEVAQLREMVFECASWNWLDDDAGEEIPKEIQEFVDKCQPKALTQEGGE